MTITTKKVASKASTKPKTVPKEASLEVVVSDAPKAKKAPKTNPNEFAIFATGGKQYRVSVGDSLKIEKVVPSVDSGQAVYKEGDKLTFNNVLLVDNGSTDTTIGTPFIKGASINATLKKIGRHPKVDVVKYKQKSRYFKRNGHRQPFFEVKIDSIK